MTNQVDQVQLDPRLRANIKFICIVVADTGETIPHTVRIRQFPRYAVAADGRVFRKGDRAANQGREHGEGWFEVMSCVNSVGYAVVKLRSGKTRSGRVVTVRRLVADAFLASPPNASYVIDHTDGCKTSNHFANLRWVTRRENLLAARTWQKDVAAEREALMAA